MDIIILHGTKGTPDGNWFPWLKTACEEKGHTVYVPKFPTPENQSIESWCRVLDKEAPVFNENTILIGHSCGATYLLRILEALKQPIAKAVFVSVLMDKLGIPEFDTLNAPFIKDDFDWETIKSNAKEMFIFHGDNDPYVPLSQAQHVSEKLKTPVRVIPNGGHLNVESGYTEFPELLKLIP